MARWKLVLCVVLVAGCSNDPISMQDRVEPTTTSCSPAPTISVSPVDGGDVNTLWVKATVSTPDGPLDKESLSFFLAKRGRAFKDGFTVPLTDATGTAMLDVGGYIAVGPDKRGAVESSDVLTVEYGGRSATSDRSKLCGTTKEVPFTPSVRTYKKQDTGVTTQAQLIATLREVAKALQRNVGPYRMPDGTSPCRLFAALVDDIEKHREWFNRDAVDPELVEIKQDMYACPSAPMLQALQVDRLADTLAES